MTAFYDYLFDTVTDSDIPMKIKISGIKGKGDLEEELRALTRSQLKSFLSFFDSSEEISTEDASAILEEIPKETGRFHFRFNHAGHGGHEANLYFFVYNENEKVGQVFVGSFKGKGKIDLAEKADQLWEEHFPLMKKLEGNSFSTKAELMSFYNKERL